MELYKICRRKSLWAAGALIGFFLVFIYKQEIIANERTVVDGVVYDGYEAIQKDREITEEFEGILTDEKISGIIRKYGFPEAVDETTNHWADGNYLTEYVTEHFSDGFLWNRNSYQPPRHILPIEESCELNYLKDSNDKLYFGYARGIERFLKLIQIEGCAISIWVIIVLAPLFCGERQCGMRQIMLTTERGTNESVRAKIQAALTMIVGSYLAVILPSFLVILKVFGFHGWKMQIGRITGLRHFFSISKISAGAFILIYLAVFFGALLMLSAVSIWISAKAKTNYASVLIGMAFWIMPAALQLSLNNGWIYYFFSSFMPFMLMDYGSLGETWHFGRLHIAAMFLTVVIGVAGSGRNWKKMDME